jgi:pyrroline-5-carboxylate reductase
MKVLIIGGGNMGLTYAHGFLKSHMLDSDRLFVLEKSPEKAEQLNALEIGTVYGTPGTYIKDMDLIVLAVKPQDINALFDSIRPFIQDQQLILSIMAGVKISTIAKGLGAAKIIRAMPNLPAQIGAGMTVYTSSPEVTRIELVTVQNLLSASGRSIYVEREDMINAATAISGSGPAYVFYFMQHLIDTAIEMGFTRSESELLTYQTFKGAVDLFNKYDISCEEWIKRVSSKGGTTEAAIASFNKKSVQLGIKEGVIAALTRAKELSEE